MVVRGLSCFVFRFKEFFTRCIFYCGIKVIGFSRGSQVVLVRWLMWCVQGSVFIYAVVL
jgi:hypothetical protein